MLDPSFVSRFMKMLTNKSLSDAEASELAETLGSREEFLAYLIIRSDFLSVHGDVRPTLMAVAVESGYEALTKRKIDGPLAASRGPVSDLGTTLLSIMEAEKGSRDSFTKLADIEQQMVRFAVADGREDASPERWIKATPPPS